MTPGMETIRASQPMSDHHRRPYLTWVPSALQEVRLPQLPVLDEGVKPSRHGASLSTSCGGAVQVRSAEQASDAYEPCSSAPVFLHSRELEAGFGLGILRTRSVMTWEASTVVFMNRLQNYGLGWSRPLPVY